MNDQPPPATLRVYAVSLIAHSSVIDTENEKPDTYTQHAPALIFADSINSAAREAKAIALKSWLRDEGWYGHNATITPVTHMLFARLKPFLDAGMIPDTGVPEPSAIFDFTD